MLEGLSKTLDMTLVYPPLVSRFPLPPANYRNLSARSRREGIHARTISTMENMLAKRHEEDAGISCKGFDPVQGLNFVLQYFEVASYNGLDTVRTIDAPQQMRKFASDQPLA